MTEPRGVTAGKLPYPESTAPLQQGANDIKALALAVNNYAQAGQVIITSNANGDANIPFPAPFPAVPVLTANPGDPAQGLFSISVWGTACTTTIGPVRFFGSLTGAALANATLRVAWVGVVAR